VHHRAGERPGDAADRLDAGDDQLAQLVDVVGLGKGDHVVWNRRRLKRRSRACCGRRRAGRNTAATARVAPATAHAGGSPVTLVWTKDADAVLGTLERAHTAATGRSASASLPR
jgi:hypothetical protein